MQQSFLRRVWPVLALLAIVVLGAVLRIMPLMQRDYWYDESFTGITVRQPMGEMMDIVTHDVHPPLYYWLLKGWTLVAGSEPVALRAFSVMFGVALIGLTFIALRQWVKGKWWPALVGALVMAINPFFVNYSQEARMYSLLAFLLLLAALLLTRAWQSKSVGIRIAYGVTLLAIVLTHYLGAVFALALVAADFFHRWQTMRGVATKSHLRWLFAAYLVPLLGGLAWLPLLRTQTQAHGSLGWVPNAPFEHIPVSLHTFLLGAPVGVPGVPPALGYRFAWLTVPAVSVVLVVLFSALVTWLTVKKKWDATLGLLGFMAIGPLLATWLLQSIGLQLYVERFLTGAAVFLVVFAVVALTKLSRPKSLSVVAAVYVLFVLLIQPWTYAAPVLPALAEAVRATAGDKLIVFDGPFDYTQGRFHLGEEVVERIRVYNVRNLSESLDGWAMVRQGSQIPTLPSEPHVVVTTQPELFPGYTTVQTVDQFSIMQAM